MVLWIDKNTFSTSLLTKAFKSAGTDFYTIGTVEDFSYLVDDLKPEIIVLDCLTFLDNPAVFHQQYEASSRMQLIPFVLIGEAPGLQIKNKVGQIQRPFDPFKIPATIKSLVTIN